MQLHGYQHTAYPDDFPLNKDDHHHTHKDMEAMQKRDALESLYNKAPAVSAPHDHGDGNVHSH
jgi:hypothetical protein